MALPIPNVFSNKWMRYWSRFLAREVYIFERIEADKLNMFSLASVEKGDPYVNCSGISEGE